MPDFKTLLASLNLLAIHNTLPSSTQGVVEQSVDPETWLVLTAPFDGVACLIGEDSNNFRGFRIISEKVELNVATVANSDTGWGAGWIPIVKGQQVRFYTNASESVTARLIPNIQSSL